MLELNDQNFKEEILQNGQLALVDFWMEGCPPCKAIAPIIEEISEDLKNKVKVGKLDVRRNPETAQKYGVMGVPTLIIFKDGEVKEKAVGLRPKEVIVKKLESLL